MTDGELAYLLDMPIVEARRVKGAFAGTDD
jgi:hypothetical protein